MPDVGAGTHERAAVFNGGQNEGGIPILIWFFVLMDGHFDVVFLAQLFHYIQRIGIRLGHEDGNFPFAREVEDLAALRLVGRQLHHADVDKRPTDPGRKHLRLDGFHVLVRQVDRGDGIGAGKEDAARNAHVLDAQGGGLVNRIVDGEEPERIGMHRQGPAQLFGVGGRSGGGGARRGKAGQHCEAGKDA
jgi:hypothetical protein